MIITLSLKVRLKFGCDVTKSSFSEVACGGNGGSVRDKDFFNHKRGSSYGALASGEKGTA